MDSTTRETPGMRSPRGGETSVSDREYRIAFRMHAFPMALSSVDDGLFVEVSDSFCEMLGLRREDILGHSSLELGFWVDQAARDAIVESLKKGDSVRDFPLDYRTARGEICQGLFSADMIDIDGRSHILSVTSDITARLEAERGRRASDERYQLVSELTSDYAYSFLVPESAEEGLELDWLSGDIETLTGYPQPELKERGGWETLILPEDLEIPERQLGALLEGRAKTVEYRIRTRSGETRWIRDYARPEIDPDTGRLARIHGAVQDVTERQRELDRRLELEAQVQQRQKLESLGVLAGGIAHDFNNLLMTISGNAEIAADDLSDDSPVQQSLGEIRHATRRATELVRQLLAYAGQVASEMERVDLSEVVREMVDLLRVTISKKVAVSFEFAPGLPAIAADATRVRQVCMNLMTNASEAIGEESGTITLRIGLEQVDDPPRDRSTPGEDPVAGPYVYLEVEDDGAGMDEETRTRIFDPFYSTKFEGRGLGLSVVSGIMRSHAGWITIRSEVGVGSAVRTWFPVTDAPEAAAAAEPLEERRFDGRTILLVDDEEAVRSVGRRMLERLGCRVVTADDGRQALDLLETEDTPFDACLMDLTMPRLSGAECMPELRRLRPGLPVVFVSGCGQQDLIEKCGGWPHSAFVSKPFDGDQLAAKLGAVLD